MRGRCVRENEKIRDTFAGQQRYTYAKKQKERTKRRDEEEEEEEILLSRRVPGGSLRVKLFSFSLSFPLSAFLCGTDYRFALAVAARGTRRYDDINLTCTRVHCYDNVFKCQPYIRAS